jgi:hypothetical protein
MSGCNCKGNKNNVDKALNEKETKAKVKLSFTYYMLKTLGFLLLVALLPLINLVIIWFMFRTLVLNKDIDLKPLLLGIGKRFKEKKEVDDDNDLDDLTEDDVVMVGVDDITNKRKSK